MDNEELSIDVSAKAERMQSKISEIIFGMLNEKYKNKAAGVMGKNKKAQS
ncbi:MULTISPECIES: hypothetical protein [unclassified Fibrobacter]|nr:MULTISPECIES: hypothetical protein [Fibrobacter]MCQ2098841.1 hypothetical protein [Fibrobacter sp.]MDO4947742.1 hypothetical protein [Fibrobacter sp.]